MVNKLLILFPDLIIGAFEDECECIIAGNKIIYWDRHETQPTSEEIDIIQVDIFALKRQQLKNQAHSICSKNLSSATYQYSPAEMNQWPEMVTEARSGNWEFFEPMVSLGMTGEEYGHVVIGKHTVLKAFFDATIAARNAHKANIDNTADDHLDNYDTSEFWPSI